MGGGGTGTGAVTPTGGLCAGPGAFPYLPCGSRKLQLPASGRPGGSRPGVSEALGEEDPGT